MGDSTTGGTDQVEVVKIADNLIHLVGMLHLPRLLIHCRLQVRLYGRVVADRALQDEWVVAYRALHDGLVLHCCCSHFSWCTLLVAALDGVDPGSIPGRFPLGGPPIRTSAFVLYRNLYAAGGLEFVRTKG